MITPASPINLINKLLKRSTDDFKPSIKVPKLEYPTTSVAIIQVSYTV